MAVEWDWGMSPAFRRNVVVPTVLCVLIGAVCGFSYGVFSALFPYGVLLSLGAGLLVGFFGGLCGLCVGRGGGSLSHAPGLALRGAALFPPPVFCIFPLVIAAPPP